MPLIKGILLVGSTGSGKTPLGDLLESKGLWGYRCHHFDFGRALRQASLKVSEQSYLSAEDLIIVRNSLSKGNLLEDTHFHIAESILNAFMESRGIQEKDTIVLNGLPRHVGQASDICQTVDVRGVISLQCPDEVVRQRIELNSGGDRRSRTDDSKAEIFRRLEIFRERTLPLLEYYRALRLPVIEIPVCTTTTPESILIQLQQNESCF